jgi:hypothetical protein
LYPLPHCEEEEKIESEGEKDEERRGEEERRGGEGRGEEVRRGEEWDEERKSKTSDVSQKGRAWRICGVIILATCTPKTSPGM